MTDVEIIKTAELCLNNSLLTENCEKCPCKGKGNYCIDVMLQNCIDLINRQKAEIEELTEKHHNECRQIAKYDDGHKHISDILKRYVVIIVNQKAEIERLNRNMDSMVNENDRLLKDILTAPVTFIPKTDVISPHTISKEAVKKFAEALKAELKNLSKVHLFGREFALVGESFVDGFVEKYEGEKNDT